MYSMVFTDPVAQWIEQQPSYSLQLSEKLFNNTF